MKFLAQTVQKLWPRLKNFKSSSVIFKWNKRVKYESPITIYLRVIVNDINILRTNRPTNRSKKLYMYVCPESPIKTV